MKFTENEIAVAKKLHAAGLEWEPEEGQYVYDLQGIIKKGSPFQEGVYFILDIKHFLRIAGSKEAIKKTMCWLPEWEECRSILSELGVGWDRIEGGLAERGAFENGAERLTLYEIILEEIERRVGSGKKEKFAART